MHCNICEFRCNVTQNGSTCGMYESRGVELVEKYPDMYLVSVPAPIEAMPMTHYYPNSKFLQVCSIGCNFRCGGCVSWLLTENAESIKGAIKEIDPGALVKKAAEQECLGIMFCFNEPAVSFHTFKKVAGLAREKGMLIGCATNGYFTEEAFSDLLDHIDFINIGIKGNSEKTYNRCGALSLEPVYRNLESVARKNVHAEVAAVYMKGMEEEVKETARRVASVSKDIPFQVMRFLPLCGADYSDEPSIKEAELLCSELKEIMNFVYLFNSPGTEYLNSNCPVCGAALIKRGFNGPMCSNVIDFTEEGKCGCGYSLPVTGDFRRDNGLEALGYYGGYKNIMSLEGIRTILAFLGEHDGKTISRVLHEIIRTDFIRDLYPRMKRPDTYLDVIDHYARLAGRGKEAEKLRYFIEKNLDDVSGKTAGLTQKPRVYFALNHPMIAVFGDKFECNLVEIAGGYCVNKEIIREEIPGIMIQGSLLNELNPEFILISGAHGYPASDVREFCMKNNIRPDAVRNDRIYNIHPYRTSGLPDWILGLMYIANIIHPEIFDYDVKNTADSFYNILFGADYNILNHNRSFDVLLLERLKN